MIKILKRVSIIISAGVVVWIALLFVTEPRKREFDEQTRRKESLAIESVYRQFEAFIQNGDFANAYLFMTPIYREMWSCESFLKTFQFMQQYAEEYRLHPQHSLRIEGGFATLYPRDTSHDQNWYGVGFEFQKIEGVWYLTGVLPLFTE
jgi:hypothetical protein